MHLAPDDFLSLHPSFTAAAATAAAAAFISSPGTQIELLDAGVCASGCKAPQWYHDDGQQGLLLLAIFFLPTGSHYLQKASKRTCAIIEFVFVRGSLFVFFLYSIQGVDGGVYWCGQYSCRLNAAGLDKNDVLW